jgi:protoporphyrinogen IX oxidase
MVASIQLYAKKRRKDKEKLAELAQKPEFASSPGE